MIIPDFTRPQPLDHSLLPQFFRPDPTAEAYRRGMAHHHHTTITTMPPPSVVTRGEAHPAVDDALQGWAGLRAGFLFVVGLHLGPHLGPDHPVMRET